MRFKKILAATDFSDLGDTALKRAAQLALDEHASFVALHVLDEPPPVNPLYAHYTTTTSPEMTTHAEQVARKALETRIPAEVIKRGVEHECVAIMGDAATVIVETAKARGADLIVISTHGRRGLTRALLGSVAEKVVRIASCAVLVVR